MEGVPTSIRVHCSAGGEPLGGAWVAVTLPMIEKNPIRLLFGPADDLGIVQITGEELAEGAAHEVNLFPMDYRAFPGGWTGELSAEVLDAAGIERLRQAVKTWGSVAHRSDADPGWVEWERRLRMIGDQPLKAEIARG